MATTDLVRERAKLQWLREKLAAQEKWVKELEGREADPLDDLFEREHSLPELSAPRHLDVERREQRENEAAAAATGAAGQGDNTSVRSHGPWSAWVKPLKAVPANWRRILGFIGADGKDAKQVRDFVEKHDLLGWDTVRAGLMHYRRDYGIIESPKRGQYRLNRKGLDILTATEDESPAVEGEAFESQHPKEGVAQLV